MLGYEFLFTGGEWNAYTFTTDHLVSYEVQFKPSPYLFGIAFSQPDELVELVIKITENPTGQHIPFDALVAPTVVAIIDDFYLSNSRTITLFVCDTADRRHEARWRKFNRWFDRSLRSADYVKLTDSLADPSLNILYHCALIVRRDNPYLIEINAAFASLMLSYRKAE